MNEAHNLDDYDLLGLGWDVGGWMGNNHGFSLAGIVIKDNTIHWPGEPVELEIPRGSSFNLKKIVSEITGNKDFEVDPDRLIIGVDAPLGFPQEFKNFLVHGESNYNCPEKEIYNELAYRETDRHIYEKLGKKPLSATFDRLGTNATVAITHVRKWSQKYGFNREPSSGERNKGNVIEVYPGLLKPDKHSPAYPPLSKLLSWDFEPGTHYYDAALCSTMALAYKASNDFSFLPPMVGPPQLTDRIREEGWIYHFPEEAVNREL
jgi:hypothetical protein